MNRYSSIQESVVGMACDELVEKFGKIQQGHWLIKDNLLFVEVQGEHCEWQFEKGDPTSEAMVLVLNNLPAMIDVLRNRRNETAN